MMSLVVQTQMGTGLESLGETLKYDDSAEILLASEYLKAICAIVWANIVSQDDKLAQEFTDTLMMELLTQFGKELPDLFEKVKSKSWQSDFASYYIGGTTDEASSNWIRSTFWQGGPDNYVEPQGLYKTILQLHFRICKILGIKKRDKLALELYIDISAKLIAEQTELWSTFDFRLKLPKNEQYVRPD